MNKHTLSAFDNDLNQVQQRVLFMAQRASTQVAQALDGLARRDLELVEQVIREDRKIDEDERELNEICIQLIARHAPQARDLRLIITAMQMIKDLERIGDEAKKIAKKTRKIIRSDAQHICPDVDLRHVAEQAITMLDRAADAFARRDLSQIGSILRQDKTVNSLFKSVTRELITFMMEDPRTITRSIDMMFAAKAIERIADHATNIAGSVVYMVKGLSIRHVRLKTATRDVEAAHAEDVPKGEGEEEA